MIGMLAAIKAPQKFIAQIMVGPSPCYINDGDYVGGFSRDDIDELLETMEANYLGWAGNLAPAIMGVPDRPELREELTNSFCRNDPDIAKHFARTTFLSDHRDDVARSTVPALILQCSDDMVAPQTVGEYMHRHMPNSTLHVIQNIGHCPHMSAPTESSRAIDDFLARTLR
jgi:sigma-B regulation protein RsbQ